MPVCSAFRWPECDPFGGHVILSFVFPSSHHRTGGVIVLYEMANALARRGHEVHFVHGPSNPHRIGSLDDLPPSVRFEDEVVHHIVDTLDDPGLPEGEAVFFPAAPPRLGLPVVIVQGFRMFTEEIEVGHLRTRAPKACVASWLKDVGLRYGVPPEQLWYVPLGIDHQMFGFRTPQGRRRYDVAMLSHPHREKGFPVGVDALTELRRRMPELQAIVFGMDPPPGPLPDGVRFWQAPDHPTLANQLYNQSRVFMQPSFHEGFGYTAVEAMACGCALVTTDNGGSRDYGIPDETAMVVPPGDSVQLAAAVERLIGDDELRTRLAQAGAELVRGRFDWDNTAAVLEHHLEAYIADPDRYRRAPADLVAQEGAG
jgi:glycosyltransferase involved in cell wall biosynthesis